jgi:hypothetical protein
MEFVPFSIDNIEISDLFSSLSFRILTQKNIREELFFRVSSKTGSKIIDFRRQNKETIRMNLSVKTEKASGFSLKPEAFLQCQFAKRE